MEHPHSVVFPATASEQSKKVLYWTIAAVSLPLAGAAIWWVTENSFNRLAPYQVRINSFFADSVKI